MKKVRCSVCKKIVYRWNYQIKSKKGIHYSIKTEFKKGHPKTKAWYESIKTRINWNTGLTKKDPRIAKNIERMAKLNKGKRRSPQTEFKKGQIPHNKGLKGFMSGEKHWNWKNGITPINHKIRTSKEFISW